MEETSFKVYGYRWVVLLAFMVVVAVNQLTWITFAPITSAAASYYRVSDLSIGLLSMCFMVVYLFMSFPASWCIDTYGIRVAVGIGAALMGIFGLLRGLASSSFTWVFIAQIGIAVGQPFILNAVTTVAGRWFPIRERATAAGLGSLAIYVGIMAGMALTPVLTLATSINTMLVIYGVAAVIAALIFFFTARERPPSPPCPPGQDERSLVMDGFKQMIRQKDFIILLIIFFIGLGAFNAVTTWIENILNPRGFSITQAGVVGGVMIVGGIVGALILPTLSDRYHKRTPFIILSLIGATLGLVGVTYASGYGLLLFSAFVLGFFLLAAGPIGYQYAAEVTYPAPEGTSNGLLILMGQISGIIFILAMDSLKSPVTGSMTGSMVVLVVLMAIGIAISTRLKESLK
jgi:sugar phosphate permease